LISMWTPLGDFGHVRTVCLRFRLEQDESVSNRDLSCEERRGSFAGPGSALSCFVLLWGRFATGIPAARLLNIK
jgi:hypothetical protein